MYSKFLFAGLVALFGALVWVGCGDEETCGCDDDAPYVDDISIILDETNDTLTLLPGERVTIPVTISVEDQHFRPMPRVKVGIALELPDQGRFDWLDSELRDSTNSLGQVYAIYTSYGPYHLQSITASASGIATQAVILPYITSGELPNVFLSVTPSIVVADSSEFAQCLVNVRILDNSAHGIAGALPEFEATGGTVVSPSPTDSNGRTSFLWTFYNEFGEYELNAQYLNVGDSVSVEVRLPEPPSDAYTVFMTCSEDTIEFVEGDTVAIRFFTQVWTETDPVSGVRVEFQTTNPQLGYIEFLNSNLQDTTDSEGLIALQFHAYGVSGDQTIFACVGDICDELLLVFREVEPEPPNIFLYVEPNTPQLADSNEVVQYQVFINAFDMNWNVLPGVVPVLSVTGGSIGTPAATDVLGQTTLPWYFFNEFGDYVIYATIEQHGQTEIDSALVRIEYTP